MFDERQHWHHGHQGRPHHDFDRPHPFGPPHEHGPHHPGRRGGRARRGESKYLLMDALQSGPKHGYEIIKTLEERSNGQYAPSPGVVYPTLQYLAEVGLVRAELDNERRVFHLTEEGQRELAAHSDEVTEFWARFAAPSAASARAELTFVIEELEYLERTVRSAMRGNPSTELLRRVRQTIEGCRNEVRNLIASPTAADDSSRG